MKRIFMILVLLLLASSACRLGPDAAEIAATMVAETAAAASPTVAASPTPIPPTSTPAPTATSTPLPSATPTITPTPGPFSFNDDFSAKNTRSWSACAQCSWENDQLVVGPFAAGNNAGENLNFILCEVCGKHKFYRMAVDVTFIEGQVDRFFGVLGPITQDHVYYLGISPYQAAIVRDYDYGAGYVKTLTTNTNGLVKAGKATNHIEITVKPGTSPNLMDVYYTLNDKTFYILSGRTAEESMIALGMSFHSVAAAYDNFEYEELEFGK